MRDRDNVIKRLITACVLTIVSASLLTTASFAWFSRNRVNDVNGIGFTSRMLSNLQIAKGYTVDPNDFLEENVYFENNEGVLLQPVSSANGETFFANTNVRNGVNEIGALSQGAKFTKMLTGDLTSYYSDFEKNLLGVRNGKITGYVDFIYTIKVASANWDDSSLKVYLQNVSLNYKGGKENARNSLNAFRVSVFTETYNATTQTFGDKVNHGIIMNKNSEYYETGKAISNVTNEGKNITRSEVNSFKNEPLRTYTVEQTEYFAITIRIWLEGEDKACTVQQFTALTDDYTLSVTVGIEKPEDNVTII